MNVMNASEPPQEPKPTADPAQKTSVNTGCALGAAVLLSLVTLLCLLGMLSERNTGAREAYIFQSFLNGAVMFGPLTLIAWLVVYYLKSNRR